MHEVRTEYPRSTEVHYDSVVAIGRMCKCMHVITVRHINLLLLQSQHIVESLGYMDHIIHGPCGQEQPAYLHTYSSRAPSTMLALRRYIEVVLFHRVQSMR